MGKMANLARALAEYVKKGDEFNIVGPLLTSRSYEGLRAGVQKAVGRIPQDVDNALSVFESIDDEGVFSDMVSLLPYLISSFREVKRL